MNNHLQLENLRHTNNWFNYQEFYDQVAGIPHFETFVEVGVWKGHSISYLARKLQGRKCQLYAVDLFEDSKMFPDLSEEVEVIHQVYDLNLRASGVRDMIIDIKEHSNIAPQRFEDRSIDFVFIDADHTYEAVKSDIIAWLPKIRPGGIISGHDYESIDVRRAVHEVFFNYVHRPISSVWCVYIK